MIILSVAMLILYWHKLYREHSELAVGGDNVSFTPFQYLGILTICKHNIFLINGKSRIFLFLSQIFPWYIFVNILDFNVDFFFALLWYLRFHIAHRDIVFSFIVEGGVRTWLEYAI